MLTSELHFKTNLVWSVFECSHTMHLSTSGLFLFVPISLLHRLWALQIGFKRVEWELEKAKTENGSNRWHCLQKDKAGWEETWNNLN